MAGLVEVVFQLCDVTLFAVVASQFVEHLHEDFKDRRGGIASNVIGLLVDVEENAVRRDFDSTLHAAAQDLILDVRQDHVCRFPSTGECPLIKQERENLE